MTHGSTSVSKEAEKTVNKDSTKAYDLNLLSEKAFRVHGRLAITWTTKVTVSATWPRDIDGWQTSSRTKTSATNAILNLIFTLMGSQLVVFGLLIAVSSKGWEQ